MTAARPWRVRTQDIEAENCLARELKISPLMARLLLGRGLDSATLAHRFLNTRLEDLPNPFALSEMDRAVERILQAVRRKEDLLIFGDYDVDGITGTALLALFLREIGFTPRVLLPHRLEDGYGLNPRTVAKILKSPPKLLVAIDNGTNAVDEIETLVREGIEVIVVDHHETPNRRPPVVALLNPKRPDSSFGQSALTEKNMASAGLVFLLLMALRKKGREEGGSSPNLKRFLDLAALGTIADVVPLVGANRILVKYGLEELTGSGRAGIAALKSCAQMVSAVTPTAVAFRLAPRLNAAGRMGDPTLALNLLLATDPFEAASLAAKLEKQNRERQQVEEKMLSEAIERVEKEQKEAHSLVVAKEGWHLGVAGIVAARLAEKYRKPSFVIAVEKGMGRGSGRTFGSLSLYDLLQKTSSTLLHFGGHHAACGLTLEEGKIPSFARRLQEILQETPAGNEPLWVDSFVALEEIGPSLVEEISRLEPYGCGNLEPLFAAEKVFLKEHRIVGENHLKGILVQGESRHEVIGFGMADHFDPSFFEKGSLRVAFSPQLNVWNGISTLQLKLKQIESI